MPCECLHESRVVHAAQKRTRFSPPLLELPSAGAAGVVFPSSHRNTGSVLAGEHPDESPLGPPGGLWMLREVRLLNGLRHVALGGLELCLNLRICFRELVNLCTRTLPFFLHLCLDVNGRLGGFPQGCGTLLFARVGTRSRALWRGFVCVSVCCFKTSSDFEL